MTPQQITLVQETFKQVPAEAAAELFYDRLFALDPSLERLFGADMKTQGGKLMTMIGVAVTGLTNLEYILPAVRDLGVRHGGYGVEREHYAVVGQALLWTLRQGLGTAFTAEVEQAWATAYGVLSSAMIEEAYSQAA